jgi:hypothetical protein
LLPEGLSVCRFCGDVRGKTRRGHVSLCLCDGLTCHYCGLGRIHRPISNSFDPHTRTFWHTPYFGAGSPCRECRRIAWQVYPNTGFPGPLDSDERLRALLEALREAHEALRPDRAHSAFKSDKAAIVALHAPESVWRTLGLAPPPDDRPLWVGLAIDLIQPPLPELRLASWLPPTGQDAVELVNELDARWRPPYRKRLPWDPLESDLYGSYGDRGEEEEGKA